MSCCNLARAHISRTCPAGTVWRGLGLANFTGNLVSLGKPCNLGKFTGNLVNLGKFIRYILSLGRFTGNLCKFGKIYSNLVSLGIVTGKWKYVWLRIICSSGPARLSSCIRIKEIQCSMLIR